MSRLLPPHRLRLSDVTPEHLLRLHQQDDFDDDHLQRLSLVCPLCWYGNSATALRATHSSVGNLQDLRQRYDNGTLSLSLCTTAEGRRI